MLLSSISHPSLSSVVQHSEPSDGHSSSQCRLSAVSASSSLKLHDLQHASASFLSMLYLLATAGCASIMLHQAVCAALLLTCILFKEQFRHHIGTSHHTHYGVHWLSQTHIHNKALNSASCKCAYSHVSDRSCSSRRCNSFSYRVHQSSACCNVPTPD